MATHTDTFETEGRDRTMSEEEYADALLRYWAAVKEAEQTITPFFADGSELTPDQRDVVADVVAQVARAEDAYFAALEVAGQPLPRPSRRTGDS